MRANLSFRVHNLFDEYRYFPKYPDKPLRTTALLFGALVQHSLVSHITLGMFLRYVLEALRKPPGSKMCKFGVAALESFRDRLPEWPQYCQHLYAIPHFAQVLPDFVPLLEAVPGARAASGAASEVASPMVRQALPGGVSANGPPGLLSASTHGGCADTLADSVASAGGAGSTAAPVAAAPAPVPSAAATGTGFGLSTGSAVLASSLGSSFGSGLQPLVGATQTGTALPSAVLAAASTTQAPPLPPQQPPPPPLPPQPPQQHPATSSAGTGTGTGPMVPSLPQMPFPSCGGSDTQAASMAAAFPAFASQPCIEELSSAASTEVAAPPDAVQDKIGFVLNNMQASNVIEQSTTLRDILEGHPGCVQWFAQYLVVKRVSLEPNFHALYGAMLTELAMKPLNRAVLQSTLQNARVLLASPKIRSSSSQRSLLKNLGSWLGQITLARNKALLMRSIDMKELICDAYERGLLIAVVPFVAKVLDACAHSRVFTPPNPWVMGLMSMLLELYSVPDLKLNLKFEIEVLAKTLKIELADIAPTNRLTNRVIDRVQTCDFANRAGVAAAALGGNLGSGFGSTLGGSLSSACGGSLGVGAPAAASLAALGSASFGSADGLDALARMSGSQSGQPPLGQGFGDKAMIALQQQQAQQQQAQQQQAQQQAEVEARRLATERQQQAAREQAQAAVNQLSGGLAPPHSSGDTTSETVIPNLSSYVHINSGLQLFAQSPQLKRVVSVAIDRAIREIIQPVVERSVTIACVTTRELMLKDFAMEPDEVRMKKAAQLMAQTLAGSLALVTCKEPLRISCSNNMRNLLQQAGVDTQLMEQAVQVCSSENLDLCCTLIEKAAKEKAVRDVEESLAPAFAIRRKHREQTGLPYYDMSIFTSGRYPASLPEALRPKAGGLLPAQRRVYEDFSRIPRVTAALAQASGSSPATFQLSSGAQGLGSYALPAAQSLSTDPNVFGRALGGSTSPLRSGIEVSLSLGSQMPAALGQIPSSYGGTALLAGRSASVGGEALSTAQVLEKLALLMAKVDAHLGQLAPSGINMPSLPSDHEVHNLIRQAGTIAACAYNRDESALAMVQRIFKRMYEQAGGRLYTQVNIHLILAIQHVSKKVSRFVSDLLFYSDDERKLHGEIVGALLHAGLLSMAELSAHLAKHIDGGRNVLATNFAVRLVRTALLEEQIATTSECTDILQALSKLLHSPSPPDGLVRLLEDASRLLGGSVPAPSAVSGVAGAATASASITDVRMALASAEVQPEVDDDSALSRARDQVVPLWDEWLVIYEQPSQRDKAYANFLGSLETAGWLLADAAEERFLKLILEAALNAAQISTSTSGPDSGKLSISFAPLDALSTLIVLLVKHVPCDLINYAGLHQSTDSAKPLAQIAFLSKALSLLIRQLIATYETRPQVPVVSLSCCVPLDNAAPSDRLAHGLSLRRISTNAFSFACSVPYSSNSAFLTRRSI